MLLVPSGYRAGSHYIFYLLYQTYILNLLEMQQTYILIEKVQKKRLKIICDCFQLD